MHKIQDPFFFFFFFLFLIICTNDPNGVLETHMEFCLPACDNPDSEFDLESFMNILSPEGGNLPLGALEDFWDGDISTLFA